MTNEILDFAQKLSTVGLSTLLVLILYGGYKGIWVWGHQYQKCDADREQWKSMALHAAGLAETTASIAKTRIAE